MSTEATEITRYAILTVGAYWASIKAGHLWGVRRDGFALAHRCLFGGQSQAIVVVRVEVDPASTQRVRHIISLRCDYGHRLWQREDFGKEF